MREEKLRVEELVLTAVLSAIIGAVFLVWSNVVWGASKLVLGLTLTPIIYGMWFIGATVPAYIVRKPLVALLGEFLAAVLELFYGSQFASTVLLYGFMQGLMSELVFFATRYKRWDWATMALAGAAPALWAAPADTVLYGITNPLSPGQRVVFWSLYFVSGALIAGVLVKALIDYVAKSSSLLDYFAVGKSVKKIGGSTSQ
ncbi:ECF transporter S component [Thermofilum pendens]|uniref:ABC transporter, permease protein n=1 Tax=Thermofilum pendens (strain DSM 2475 / Hrk 5) TaxID=368408 RepID=A1RW98_THEPD|nr:ECF transporter S component [Thermofilum pendens]ABL77478.1 ABC transporter, permease protein [Thermofilum pendens Hrk 5]